MPDNKLSAREAALLAQVRAELQKKSTVQPDAPAAKPDPPVASAEAAAPLARAEPTAAAAPIEPVAPAGIEPAAPAGATPATGLDPAERIAALMAAARAETERLRRRQRQFYVWAPVAFMSAVGLWTLLWMWQRL